MDLEYDCPDCGKQLKNIVPLTSEVDGSEGKILTINYRLNGDLISTLMVVSIEDIDGFSLWFCTSCVLCWGEEHGNGKLFNSLNYESDDLDIIDEDYEPSFSS